ncbi:uncharacterized protein LOC142224575 [Haematobia irritans]|uniref:uncharacterized protein LOC142224575 n=1 Tax=Haematobia irritans TaxID=7368 RepID=UPI003F505640
MADPVLLRKFKKFAALFLEFEREYNAMSSAAHTMYTVELRKEEFRSLWNKVKTSYEKFNVDCECAEEQEKEASDLFRQCREAYITCAAGMGELSQTFLSRSVLTSTALSASPMTSQSGENRGNDHRLRLPPCTTEIFHGDYLSWPSFRDMFTVEKLFYLRQNTQGEALEIIKKSQLTNDGFEVAWNNLKDRYENKRILVNSQLKILFNLLPVKSESAGEIKRLQGEINNCIASLKLHGVSIESWDPIFVFLCSTRLPMTTLSLWEQTVKDKTEISKWADLDRFLTARFQSLETVFDFSHVDVNEPSSQRKLRTYQTSANKISCFACSQDHFLKNCNKFLRMSQEDRFAVIKKNNLCINCFSNRHRLNQCSSKLSCERCKLRHNTLLHRESQTSLSSSITVGGDCPATGQSNSQESSHREQDIQNCFATSSRHVLLGTAVVNIRVKGILYKARALLDPGSQASFISERLQRRLGLPTTRVNARISGLNNALAGLTQKQCIFELTSGLDEDIKIEICGLVLPHLTGRLPSSSISLPERFSVGDIRLADPYFAKSDQVDILIGADVYPQVILDGIQRNVLGSLVAQNTIFGWVLTGQLDSERGGLTTMVSFCTEVSLSKQLEKFWKLEEPPMASVMTEEETYCEDLYTRTTRRSTDGRFIVCLPFKPQHAEGKGLGISRTKAFRQFLRNESCLLRKPDLKDMYDTAMREYETLGQMIRVAESSEGGLDFYLPHHAVVKPERTSTKLRNDLTLLIIRWRFYRYVFNGDIEKMCRQILVDDRHTRFQRVVFRYNSRRPVEDFELKTVTFGINCAPFLAIRSLLQLAKDVEDELPLAARILRHMIRSQSVDHGVIEDLLSENFLEIDEESKAKTLGIRWNAKNDSFYFSVKPIIQKDIFTKRRVLSIISTLFDPAGWLGPVIIVAKMLMQQIWTEGTDWDECLTESSDLQWRQFVEDYENLHNVQLPRWIGFDPNCHMEIHGFSDASEKAYGACVYARVQSADGDIQTHLLLAKSRVAPLKTISLPRLELCGTLLFAELIGALRADLSFDSKCIKFFCWSDSTIVLAWLQKPPASWTTFVSNRVSKIVDLVGKDWWRHVSSEHNPADIVSRGVRSHGLIGNSLWWQGPSWMRASRDWDVQLGNEFHTEEECRSINVHFTYIKDFEDILLRFSSYSRALRVMAFVYRFVLLVKRKSSQVSEKQSSFSELQLVKIRLIIVTQKVYFPDEYFSLSNDRPLSTTSKLLNLNPFIDGEGLIRVGGRLSNATSLSFNEKHPIILPYESQFSRLLITFIHKITLHGGNQLMLRVLRTEFWIPRSRNLIRSVIAKCRICAICSKRSKEQIMAALPVARTIIERPFTRTGVDFAGPFDIKNYRGRACLITKGYASIFVCFAIRAIHLEAVSDLTTATFLAAFARFVSRRGCPKEMFSDNGTNFVGASRALRSDFRNFIRDTSSEIVQIYSNNGLNWHFNPAGAPHMGGLWEAGVKSFKHHFRRISFNLRYTFEEFCTLLARIESCLNSRPLCPLSEDVSCVDALTPGHFLVGGPILAPPEPQINEALLSIINLWQRVKAINQNLCMRWKEEYLKEIIKRNKWKTGEWNLKVGDMVVIRDDNLPPNEWRLGRIAEVFPGADGKVRVAEIRTSKGPLVRPIVKLVRLPMD